MFMFVLLTYTLQLLEYKERQLMHDVFHVLHQYHIIFAI